MLADQWTESRFITTTRQAFLHARQLLDALSKIEDGHLDTIDSIINQLMQKSCVEKADLSQSQLRTKVGEHVATLLLAKIDKHVTNLCVAIKEDLEECQRLADAATRCYNCLAEGYGAIDRNGLLHERLKRRTPKRPSIFEMCSWLDDVLTTCRQEVTERRELLARLALVRTEEAIEMLKHSKYCWKRPPSVVQRMNTYIAFTWHFIGKQNDQFQSALVQ
ncbi:Protein toll [Trichuris trichiura]|uniref:Protein toll n=1 Tax=Trichuris trichiura TaxID=36087 RepID=A0A077YY24_TRITR|nr:Protein toll [Trichuris trichiura]